MAANGATPAWPQPAGLQQWQGQGAHGGVGIGYVGHVTIGQPSTQAVRPVRSTYLEQVKRIAPPRLIGREAELAELAGFCLDARRGPYVWWRAEKWAGKSALMSTFVLHPPEQLAGRVRILSFFITARLADQDTRDAFTTALVEQLSALTGQDLPTVAGEATREAYLLDQLAQAATACQVAGGTLVLVVDGLDEDRGVTLGPDAHSIAGLLPADPPAGMRIIVAGRPNPPIPDDVPDWHPLRDPGVIHLLAGSPHARDLQRLSQSELRRLLKGSPVEQDLLGLLTAARGGLSGPDLRELTGADLVQIEDVLHTVSGRTFTRRPSTWAPDSGPEVYLLGHEELHNAAVRYLGESRLAGYRDRLHSWADTYRTPRGDGRQPWPEETPQYLLRGYVRILHTLGDTARLVALATDPRRHDRMLDLSGGDAAALGEIKTAQDHVLAQPEPDLLTMARLSIRRHDVETRNANIPTGLPAVWVAIGQPARAESLANGITDPDRQAQALAGIARAMAVAGDLERAETLALAITNPSLRAQTLTGIARAAAVAGDLDRAETIVRAITETIGAGINPYLLARTLADVARAVAVAGDPSRARRLAGNSEAIARSITDVDWRARTLAAIAPAMAVADLDWAEAVARSITDSGWRARSLAGIAQVVATAVEPSRARRLAGDAETIARSVIDPDARARALVGIAQVVAAAGDLVRARGLAGDAESIARTIADPDERAQALADIAQGMAAVGDHDRAETVARSVVDPDWRAQALAGIAQAMAVVDPDRAETIARSVTDSDWRAQALADIARVVAAAGDPDRAEMVARSISDPDVRSGALADIAQVVAAAGEPSRARRLAGDAETTARSIVDPDVRAHAQVSLARAMAAAGDPDRAETFARSVSDPDVRWRALAGLVQEMAIADPDRAEAIARSITDLNWQTRALAGLLPATADPGRAQTIVRSIVDPDVQARALARALAAVGERGRAWLVAGGAETIARSIVDPNVRARALADIALAVAAAEPDRAERIARSIVDSDVRARSLAGLARAVAAAGDLDRAWRLAGEAEAIAHTITDPDEQAQALADIAQAVALADLERAETIARSIVDPDQRVQTLACLAEVVGLPRGRRLLAGAFAVGSWHVPLPALAKLLPGVVLQIAAEVSGDPEQA